MCIRDSPWQSDEGVGHELDSLRIQDATWSLEQLLSWPIQRTFLWNVPGKAEISPSVEKSEKEAKDQRLEEPSRAPVRSVIFYFPPQGSHLKASALIQLLKLKDLNLQIISQLFTNLRYCRTSLIIGCHPSFQTNQLMSVRCELSRLTTDQVRSTTSESSDVRKRYQLINLLSCLHMENFPNSF